MVIAKIGIVAPVIHLLILGAQGDGGIHSMTHGGRFLIKLIDVDLIPIGKPTLIYALIGVE